MPFKTSGRASLIGETTAGTYSQTYSLNLGDGMSALIAATTETFPDGTPFEGVGIVPDYLTVPTAEDLRLGNDPILQQALQIAATRN